MLASTLWFPIYGRELRPARGELFELELNWPETIDKSIVFRRP